MRRGQDATHTALATGQASTGMKQRTLETLYGYWNEVRAGRLAQRLEIEPSRIAAILAETFMLERIDARTYRIA